MPNYNNKRILKSLILLDVCACPRTQPHISSQTGKDRILLPINIRCVSEVIFSIDLLAKFNILNLTLILYYCKLSFFRQEKPAFTNSLTRIVLERKSRLGFVQKERSFIFFNKFFYDTFCFSRIIIQSVGTFKTEHGDLSEWIIRNPDN